VKIQSFIFNWRNQFDKTIEKETKLSSLGYNTVVINSDELYDQVHWVNLGESAYFTDQFIKALDLFDGDVLFHVQGDASYDDWNAVIKDARDSFETYKWGIYAPNVDYTWYTKERTDIEGVQLRDKTMKLVACPDCTCWFIHKDIIDVFKQLKIDMSPYKMGWGWDIILPGISYLMGRPVIRDYYHTIDHPPGTNYNKDQAENEMAKLFNSLPHELKVMFSWIKGDRQQILQLFNKSNV
jgi:hypothetical protein